MSFEYDNRLINILDTPGHKDFAEDTYRTLTAVDSVILVIDCVKGVEEQTEKLMEVCRMRDTPVQVFINKMDRDGRDPYDLIEEVEEKLGIQVFPVTWPVGIGKEFKGVWHLQDHQMTAFTAGSAGEEMTVFKDKESEGLTNFIGNTFAEQLDEDLEFLNELYDDFDQEAYLNGQLAPVFFGSAINNFGVQELLDYFLKIAPSPVARPTQARMVEPLEKKFTGFVFKIHANLDPKHRDRIAFLRICSGVFERNTFYMHTRINKKLRFSNPTSFMASKKSIVDMAFPGDVVGLYDAGNFKIGDTLTEGEGVVFQRNSKFLS